MFGKKKETIEDLIDSKIEKAQRQHWQKWHGGSQLYIHGVEIGLCEFFALLLNHLGITLKRTLEKHTLGKTELVKIRKKRKSVSKSKKK